MTLYASPSEMVDIPLPDLISESRPSPGRHLDLNLDLSPKGGTGTTTSEPPAPSRKITPPLVPPSAYSLPIMQSPPSPALPLTPNSIPHSGRYLLPRPLSPDLPQRDALYLFSNFSSYMRSPNEGATGISSSEDFKDVVRLLDFARGLAAQPHYNVHVLHVKYRYSGPTNGAGYTGGDVPSLGLGSGQLKASIPQPFSVLNDPVVKIDYQENGVFEPLPAQAIFGYIAKACQPPPRIVVYSYVNSVVTQNHLASLSTWGLTSSPPAFIFSPLETRLRVTQPIQFALHHAIPMSMYAYPLDAPASSPLRSTATSAEAGVAVVSPMTSPYLPYLPPARPVSGWKGKDNTARRYSNETTPSRPDLHASWSDSSSHLHRHQSRVSGTGTLQHLSASASPRRERSYPADPIASLTVVTDPAPAPSSSSNEAGRGSCTDGSGSTQSLPRAQVDRIPLWALAPGVGVLHGSTSASIGVKLSDFSALNLIADQEGSGITHAAGAGNVPVEQHKSLAAAHAAAAHNGRRVISGDLAGIRTSPINVKDIGKVLVPPVEPISRPQTPAAKVPELSTISISNSTKGSATAPAPPGEDERKPELNRHLTPPEKFVPPELFSSPGRTSYPARRSKAKVPGWRRGRKESVEDVLEELGFDAGQGGDMAGISRQLGKLDINAKPSDSGVAPGLREIEEQRAGQRAEDNDVNDQNDLLAHMLHNT